MDREKIGRVLLRLLAINSLSDSSWKRALELISILEDAGLSEGFCASLRDAATKGNLEEFRSWLSRGAFLTGFGD